MADLAPPRSLETSKLENVNKSNPASISDPPLADQRILHDGKTYTTIKEGLAYVLIPPDAPLSQDPSLSKGEGPAQSVFYNPIQQYNRDLTVLAIRAFGEAQVAERNVKKGKSREKRHKKGPKKQAQTAQDANKRKLEDVATENAPLEPALKKNKPDRNRYVQRNSGSF